MLEKSGMGSVGELHGVTTLGGLLNGKLLMIGAKGALCICIITGLATSAFELAGIALELALDLSAPKESRERTTVG